MGVLQWFSQEHCNEKSTCIVIDVYLQVCIWVICMTLIIYLYRKQQELTRKIILSGGSSVLNGKLGAIVPFKTGSGRSLVAIERNAEDAEKLLSHHNNTTKRSGKHDVSEEQSVDQDKINETGDGIRRPSNTDLLRVSDTSSSLASLSRHRLGSTSVKRSSLKKKMVELFTTKQEHAVLQAQSRKLKMRRHSKGLGFKRRWKIGANSRLLFHVPHSDNKSSSIYEVKLREIHLVKRLAVGPLSEVYAAIWRDIKVGVKLLMPKEGMIEDMELAVRNFRREIWLMGRLKHPNIVHLVGASLTMSCYVLVMEYMSNGSLYDYLRDESNFFPSQMIITSAFDIASGMKYIHQSGVLQRDLKSKNLLLSENLVVKVSDFGLSRLADKSYGVYTFVGTPFWVAPEIIRHEPYNEKADIYSYGVVLWELVERKDPYEGLNAFQVPFLVANEGLRPEKLTNTCPLGLSELMLSCWDADPSKRPSFREIYDTIQKLFAPTTMMKDLNTHVLTAQHSMSEEELTAFTTSHKTKAKEIPIAFTSRLWHH